MPLTSFKLPTFPWRRILILALEGLMALVAVLALVIILFVGRLMYGPLTTTSLTPWIEQALSQPQYGLTAKINQSIVHWDSAQREVAMDLDGVQFLDPLGQKVADIPQILVRLSPLGLFMPAHTPWVVMVRQPQLHLRIDTQDHLHLGALQAGESNILEKDEETTLTPEMLRTDLRDLTTQSHHSPFGLFSNVTIQDALITLIDEPRNETWNFSIPQLSMARAHGDREGHATVHITHGQQATDLDLNLRYVGTENLFHAILSFQDISPEMLNARLIPFKVTDYIIAPVSGALTMIFNDNLDVQSGLLNLNLGAGQIIVPNYYPAPLVMHKAAVTAAYTAKNKTLEIDPFSVELEKTTLSGHGTVHFEGDTHAISAQLKLSGLKLDDLPMYWPEKVATNARVWILANMKKGVAEEATANIDISVPGNDFDNAKLDKLDGTIAMSGVQLRYWEPLPPLENVSAFARYDSHHFDIDVKGGVEAGTIQLEPSHVIISGLDADDQIATVEAHLKGPAQDILKVLNRPPLHYADKMKINPEVVTGGAEGVIKTSFPLIKALLLDQMNITAETKLMDVGIARIVDLLSIGHANVTMGVDVHALTVDGEGVINGIPAHMRWDEKFSPPANEPLSHAVANAIAPADSAANFGVGFALHSDPMPVTVTYDRYPNLSRLTVLADARKARLDVPDVWYSKPAGLAANIAIGLEWGGGVPMRLTKVSLIGDNLNVQGQGSFDGSGKILERLTLNPFIMGLTNAQLDYTRGPDNVPQWALSGQALDIRGLLQASPEQQNVPAQIQGAKPEEGLPPLRLDVQVGRLIAGDHTEFGNTHIRGVRDIYGWSMLNVSSVAMEQTPFNLSIAPYGGRTVLAASTPNLGNVLRSLDITDTLIGGKFQMDGKSEPNDVMRSLFGHIKLTDFRVKNMPILVKLLAAISPDGLMVLGNQSLHFDELSSEYIWNKNSFIFTKANTATGTLGLTAAGKIDLVNSRIDLEGQVIPVYFISKILGAIPVIGDILTGGNGHGVFAATYQVKGPVARPSVTVNPVSVLAPGIIRDILFTNPNITKEKK